MTCWTSVSGTGEGRTICRFPIRYSVCVALLLTAVTVNPSREAPARIRSSGPSSTPARSPAVTSWACIHSSRLTTGLCMTFGDQTHWEMGLRREHPARPVRFARRLYT
ncbi:hypothetical protein ACF082_34350 [Streptomyces lydicus]|uniref:hypothetical protein n=1 Tax=Streptomyces lydicus TaxID=47763 RepID=UPI00370295CF